MDAPALGRVTALDAGLPVDVGGLQLDRRCGSGLQAVINATMQVAAGASDVVIVGGADSMSRATLYTYEVRRELRGGGLELHDSLAHGRVTADGLNHPLPGGMVETAENLGRQYRIPAGISGEPW
jgi:acetyl-CoA C-acetyltransferase